MALVHHYQKINFCDFNCDKLLGAMPVSSFEQAWPWLTHTVDYLLSESAQVYVHTLWHKEKLLLALPLIHQTIHQTMTRMKFQQLRSVASCYSTVTIPYFANTLTIEESERLLALLFTEIMHQKNWHQMLIGPIDLQGLTANRIQTDYFFQSRYSSSDNYFEDNINNFADYYAQRPSQLRNTIKRRSKKLAKVFDYRIKIVTAQASLTEHFIDYQSIYQKSWKGDELNFDFIRQVCLSAAQENKVRMGLLFLGDVAVAAQIWFVHQGCASIFKLAYDPKYQEFSVGSILSLALSEFVIETDKVHRIEFGSGSEAYKQDWMSAKQQRIILTVFNHRSVRGTILALRYFVLPKVKAFVLRLLKIGKYE